MAHRAANGEGSIYQRKSDGLWIFAWPEDGRRRTRSAKTQKAAKAIRKEILDRLNAGAVGLDSKSTLEAWATHWVENLLPIARTRSGKSRGRALAATTKRTYASAITAQVIPSLGAKRLDQLTPGVVQAFLDRIADEHSASYAAICHKALTKCLDDARRERLLASNPCRTDVDVPSGRKTPKVVPEPAQVRELISECPTPRLRAFTATLGFTGLRISEALGLTWPDVDFDAGTITVMGKGSRERTIPMAKTLAEELRAWQRAQRRERMSATWWGEGDWVLSSVHGTQWSDANARKLWRPVVAKVCPGATPHSLRHATATLLLEEGIPAKIVSDLLGHSSIRVTLDIYTHTNPKLLQPAADAMDRGLAAKPVATFGAT